MCEVVSFFVSDTEVVSAHPLSHGKSQDALKLKLDKREQWSEGEWEEDHKLIVRHTDPEVAARRRSVVLATYPTRESLIAALRPAWEKHGNYLVESAEDAARVPEVVRGILIVRVAVPIPQLVRVLGTINASTLITAEGVFPSLESVGGGVDLGRLTIAKGAFPSLTSVGGALYIESLMNTDGAFPSLAYVGGELYTESMRTKEKREFTARVAAKNDVATGGVL